MAARFAGQGTREERAIQREKSRDLQRVLLEFQPNTDQHVHVRKLPEAGQKNQMDYGMLPDHMEVN